MLLRELQYQFATQPALLRPAGCRRSHQQAQAPWRIPNRHGIAWLYGLGSRSGPLVRHHERKSPANSGKGRLRLAPFPTATTRQLATAADGLRVAPWPRLVVDLRRSGVRGEEAAEHLRETVHDR